MKTPFTNEVLRPINKSSQIKVYLIELIGTIKDGPFL
jgi:hypothetical protein